MKTCTSYDITKKRRNNEEDVGKDNAGPKRQSIKPGDFKERNQASVEISLCKYFIPALVYFLMLNS